MEILGPARLWYGQRLMNFSPLEKVIHMALLVAGGRLTVDELAEAVWVIPTGGSLATLRGCLSKTRRKVEAIGGSGEQLTQTIRISGGKSVVCLPGDWDVDAERFRATVAAGREAYQSGRFSAARSQVSAALQLWYGNPLPDAGSRPFAVKYKEQLHGIHWSATLTRLKAEMCLGGHRELIAELGQMLEDRPDEGEVVMLLAVALYRSDRVGEAGQICQQALSEREEQGIHARRLRDLQSAILRNEYPAHGPLDW